MTHSARCTVPALLLHSLRELRELEELDETSWDSSIDRLLDALAQLPLDESEILREVVATSAVLQQFLLELAVRPSPGRSTGSIFETLASLLQDTRGMRGRGMGYAAGSDRTTEGFGARSAEGGSSLPPHNRADQEPDGSLPEFAVRSRIG